MATWDSMNASERAAMRDAGRNEGGGHERRGRLVEPTRCPRCGGAMRATMRQREGGPYYVDETCDACGITVVDEEGGV